ncbi:MAG: hypothetical protein ACT6Q8_03505 [Niveispirillum sp.]|uniref:hypothetical protein n=1 Tax=Niveispirillum sp. TaxID=1917217 RepID=UPI0040370B88
MTSIVKATTPILIAFTITALLISLGLIVGGVTLVWLGGVGDTELTLLGNSFKSTNVGVVGIFCGAVLGIISLRKLIGTIERIALSEGQRGK